jgi:hypothetical protein
MALPEPKPGELTVEADRDLAKLLKEAAAAEKAWRERKEQLRKKIQESMGEATAALVDGELAFTNRYKNTYREKDLRTDYPDLTDHYVHDVVVPTFDMAQFAAVHPDIAKHYQTRAFIEVK